LFATHPKEPFMTLARSTAAGKRTPGVGLGLFVVKKIADVHGWQVTAKVEAREGEPSELVITVEWGR
jgi:signal transduction histidine kinase